ACARTRSTSTRGRAPRPRASPSTCRPRPTPPRSASICRPAPARAEWPPHRVRCRLPGWGARPRARRADTRPRVGAFAAAMLLAAGAAAPAAGDAGRGGIVRLTVTEVSQGDVQAVLRDGDVLVRATDLERAGVGRLGARREPIAGEDHVSLMSLAPDAAWSFD